jgi:ppGpp synthetase/RelA/SpoT-type nucleotidyltranferase
VRERLLNVEVTHRAKAPLSLAKKLVLKPGYTELSAIPDLAGARLTVAGLHDRDVADHMITKMFPTCVRDDKTPDATDRFGYLGIHYDTRLGDIHLSRAPANLRDVRCEVQLHTRVQGAWAMIAHDSVYKPNLMPTNEQKRHFNRLAALLEVFDHEAERGLEEMRADPNLAMAQLVEGLQARFFRLTDTVGNLELSLSLVPLLVEALYDAPDRATVAEEIDRLMNVRGPEIASVVGLYANDDRHLLISQPELLLVWERLQNDSYQVLARWPETIDKSFLHETAVAIGFELPEP